MQNWHENMQKKIFKIPETRRMSICYTIPNEKDGGARGDPTTKGENEMTTKTIKTNKYGEIDIRRTSEKVSVYFPFRGFGRNYTRVAWEDTNACYWVKVDGYWYKTYRRIGEGYKADGATIGFDA